MRYLGAYPSRGVIQRYSGRCPFQRRKVGRVAGKVGQHSYENIDAYNAYASS
jgi:hypothetical protein